MNIKINKKIFLSLFATFFAFMGLAWSISSQAHHSFAIYDFSINTEFKGEVNTIKFRNPHITMILNHHEDNGDITEINFIEGAPANMLVRNGLRPQMISVGTTITVIGSPLRADPTQFFIQNIILEDGTEFSTMQR